MIRTTQNGRMTRTTLRLVLDDRSNEDDLKMDQCSIAERPGQSFQGEAAPSPNVQARSKPARELTRSDKRAVTALDRKLVVPYSPNSAKLCWGRGFFVSLPKTLAKKTRS
jgi:hypothetical protein